MNEVRMLLDDPIGVLPGVGPVMKPKLARMGIATVRDLAFHFPTRYEDFSQFAEIASLSGMTGSTTIIGTVKKVANRRAWKRRMTISEAQIDDGTGTIVALWFNRPFLVKQLQVGETYRFAGKVTRTKLGLRLVAPMFESAERGSYLKPFMPVYPTVDGVSQLALRKLMSTAAPFMNDLEETLPHDVRSRLGLSALADAVRMAHFPSNGAERDAARRRLGFDEVLALQLSIGKLHRMRQKRGAPVVPFNKDAVKEFVDSLPFPLTNDQRVAAMAILKDMDKDSPMYRLLDGDVGSGKTLVAAIAMRNAAKAGFQCALMAPTEILARQHYETLSRVYSGTGLRVALWTNAYKRAIKDGKEVVCAKKPEQAGLNDDIAEARIDIVIGTHALIEDSLRFSRLALAVVDEQHRFGVKTRQILATKSGMEGVEPHLLSMTATPIPRSLALTVFGDLDLSVIKEKPKGRQPITTVLVKSKDRKAAFEKVRKEIAMGRQAFVVCPLIEQSDKVEAASVAETFAQLQQEDLAGIPMAMLHGKMSAEEKEKTMRDMVERRVMVLVSTSVIEVGVDVPNATVMCIEGAERFGLAQLHQFRGRVGRGEHPSWCLLLPSAAAEGDSRLAALTRIDDGFTLAEKDLELRGPGDVLGTAQSGQSAFTMVSFGDLDTIAAAREVANTLLDRDPELAEHSALKFMVRKAAEDAHLE